VYDQSLITPELIKQRFEASNNPDITANPPLRPPPGPPPKESYLSNDPRLKSLQNPALFVWGLNDLCNPVEGMEGFKVMPNADFVLLSKCGHWAQWELPGKFNDLVLGFLRRP
jgi:4,5:9,10-diseco-3-hydroxy-5,9,17-trioxoandrosta-1(10),2-diene-4-oate hydrolase